MIESYMAVYKKLNDLQTCNIWHERFGHPSSSMMQRVIENSHGHPLKSQKIPQTSEFSCEVCSLGKLIIKPSLAKVEIESPMFFENIQANSPTISTI